MLTKDLKSKLVKIAFFLLLPTFSCISTELNQSEQLEGSHRINHIIDINYLSNFSWSKEEDKIYFLHTTSNKDATIESNLYTFDINKKIFEEPSKLFLTKPIKRDEPYFKKVIPLESRYFNIYIENNNEFNYYTSYLGLQSLKISPSTEVKDLLYPINPNEIKDSSNVSFDLKFEIYKDKSKDIFYLNNLETKNKLIIEQIDLEKFRSKEIKQISFFSNSKNFVCIFTDKRTLYAILDLETGKLSNISIIDNKVDGVLKIFNYDDNNLLYLGQKNFYKYNFQTKQEYVVDNLYLNKETLSLSLSNTMSISESGTYIVFINYEAKSQKRTILIKNIKTGEKIKEIDLNELKKAENSIPVVSFIG